MILISYLSPVLHPYRALSIFTDWWQFLPFIRISTLRTPHATCIFMSHRVSLLKPSPLQIRALHRHHTVMWMHESLNKYHPMKTRESMELYLHKILNLALDRLEWLVSSSTCFNHRARAPPYHWVGCCVGPRNNPNTMNTMEYKKSLATARKQTPWSSSPQRCQNTAKYLMVKKKNTNFIKVKICLTSKP